MQCTCNIADSIVHTCTCTTITITQEGKQKEERAHACILFTQVERKYCTCIIIMLDMIYDNKNRLDC